jgi:hypothetical protein
MSTKVFFENVSKKAKTAEISTPEQSLEAIKNILTCSNIFAVDSADGKNYTVYVQKDVQRLADAFGISVTDAVASDIKTAAEKIEKDQEVLREELLPLIKDYYKQISLMESGQYDFLNPYNNHEQLNKMLTKLSEFYDISTFSSLKALCKSLSYDLLLDKIDFAIRDIEKEEEEAKSKWYYESHLKGWSDKIQALQTKKNEITNTHYFSREMFSMLYVRLDDLTQYEKEIEKFLTIIRSGKFETLTIEK